MLDNFCLAWTYRTSIILYSSYTCWCVFSHFWLFCRAQIICNMGDALGPELVTCLPIFLDRLKNEITRLTAVKALSMIAEWVSQVLGFLLCSRNVLLFVIFFWMFWCLLFIDNFIFIVSHALTVQHCWTTYHLGTVAPTMIKSAFSWAKFIFEPSSRADCTNKM